MATFKEIKKAELRFWEARRRMHLRDAAKARKMRRRSRQLKDNPLRREYAAGSLKLAAIARKLADAARSVLNVL